MIIFIKITLLILYVFFATTGIVEMIAGNILEANLSLLWAVLCYIIMSTEISEGDK